MGAKALADNVGFIGYEALDQFFSRNPLQAVGGGENVGCVGTTGGAAALAAVAQIKRVEGPTDLVLNASTEAGTFDWFTHVYSPLSLTGDQSADDIVKMALVYVGIGEADKAILVRTEITAGQA